MTATVLPASVDPVSSQDRIHTLDILRGFALFGMIVVHFHQRVDLPAKGLEDLIGWFVWVGIETKSWGTFAFLFGVGFAVLLRRIEARGLRVVSFYLRRLFVLALFGVIAEACFGFNVLLSYALWGVPLLFIRRWSTPALFALAALAVAAHSLYSAGTGLHWWGPLNRAAAEAQGQALRAAVAAADQTGSFWALTGSRLALMRYTYLRPQALMPDVTLTLFILGLLAVRHGLIDRPREHTRAIMAWMGFGFASWAFGWLVLYRMPDLSNADLNSAVKYGFGIVHEQWLCFTFIGTIMLLISYRPVWQERLRWFGWSGRMALTNYMLQIAALDYLISGYGISLRLRPYLGMVGAMLLFGAEVLLSRLWLSRYRFGPCEWLWRSLTYGQAQPMRRVAAARAPATALS